MNIDSLREAARNYKQVAFHSAAMTFMLNEIITEIEGVNTEGSRGQLDQRLIESVPQNGKRKVEHPRRTRGIRSEKVLSVFQKRKVLSTFELYEELAISRTKKRRACYQTVKRLVRKGFLKPTSQEGTYRLTALGRKAT